MSNKKMQIVEKYLEYKGLNTPELKKTKGFLFLRSAVEKVLEDPTLQTRNKKLMNSIAEEYSTTTQNVMSCVYCLLRKVGIKQSIGGFLITTNMEISHMEMYMEMDVEEMR